MNELRDTSDKVMYARRLLIDLTADYNVKLVSFPSNLIANIFHFEKFQVWKHQILEMNLKSVRRK